MAQSNVNHNHQKTKHKLLSSFSFFFCQHDQEQTIILSAHLIEMMISRFVAKGKSIKTEPGEVTSPPHSSSKKDDNLKRERESQEMNDSDEDDEEEDGDLLEEEEVGQYTRLHSKTTQSRWLRLAPISFTLKHYSGA